MDTCSVKVHPVRAMLEAVPVENPVIGTHPMFGPDSAGGGVDGLPMLVYARRAPMTPRWTAGAVLRVRRAARADG